MTTPEEFKSSFSRAFAAQDLRSARQVWRFSADELTWYFQLQSLPFGARFGLDLGVHLGHLGALQGHPRPNLCEIGTRAEVVPPVAELYPDAASNLFDLSSSLSDDERERGVAHFVAELCDYVRSIDTVPKLREAYARGELRGYFIRWDAREYLASA
jgi:hypothetical protein